MLSQIFFFVFTIKHKWCDPDKGTIKHSRFSKASKEFRQLALLVFSSTCASSESTVVRPTEAGLQLANAGKMQHAPQQSHTKPAPNHSTRIFRSVPGRKAPYRHRWLDNVPAAGLSIIRERFQCLSATYILAPIPCWLGNSENVSRPQPIAPPCQQTGSA